MTDDAPQDLAAPAPERPTPGTALQFRWRKWDGGAHWVNDCVYLGSDEWGDWLGQPTGWRSARPGRVFPAETPAVMLIPPAGDYVLTVNAAPHRVRIYIDIAWDVRWQHGEPRGIDMDLDVVRATDGRGLFIDDRDEWDEHRVAYGYPLELVARLEELAIDLERRVGAAEAPFDDATPDAWLARLAALEPVAPPAPVGFGDHGTASGTGTGTGGPGTAA